MKKRAYFAISLIAALIIIPGLGLAQSSGGPNEVTPDKSVVSRGESMTVTAQTFQEGSTATAKVFSTPVTVGTDVADSSGVVVITFKVPSSLANGQHTVTVFGDAPNGNPLSVSSNFVVSGGVLTPTGTNSLPWLIAAVGIIGVGGVLIGLGRRRPA